LLPFTLLLYLYIQTEVSR